VEALRLETIDLDEMEALWMDHTGFGDGGGGGSEAGDLAVSDGSVVESEELRALVRHVILDQFQGLRMRIRLRK
jgi:hypothetical protein